MLSIPEEVRALLGSGAALAPILGVRLHWPSDPRTYLDQDVVLDGVAVAARVVALEQVVVAAADERRPALPSFEARVRLVDAPAAGAEGDPALSARLAAVEAARLRVEWIGAWAPAESPAPRPLASSEVVTLAEGRVAAWRRSGAEVVLEVRDAWRVAGEREAAPRFVPSDPAGHPFAVAPGERVPWVFGRARGVRLLPWRFGASGRLAADLQPGAATMALESVEGFPDAGSVQVGDEVIGYEVVGRSARLLGSAGRPLARPEAAWHPAGEAVWLVPAGGFAWKAAAHACAAVEAPRHDEGELAPGTWTTEATPEAGGGVHTIVVLPRLATRVVAPAATARVRVDASVGASWGASAFNTALSPEAALDADDATAARVSLARPRLDLECAPVELGAAGFGAVRRAALVVRLAAAPSWRSDSGVWVGATDGVASIVRAVVPPAGSVVDGVPYHIPLRTWRIDVTTAAAALGEMVRGGHRLFVLFAAHPADQAVVQVASLHEEFEVERPALRRAAVALRADVAGWPAGGAVAVESPSRLAAALVAAPEAFDQGAAAPAPAEVEDLERGEQARGERARRVVRDATTWRRLLGALCDEGGLALLPAGGSWRLRRRRWPDDLVAPDATLPALDAFAAAPELAEGDEASGGGPAPRAWLVHHGREEEDAAWPGLAVARLGDAAGGDGGEEAEWLAGDQREAATRLAVRRLDARGAATARGRVEVAWSALRHAWIGDEVVVEVGGEAGAARFGRLERAELLADRSGLALGLRERSAGAVAWSGGPARLLAFPSRGFGFVFGDRLVVFLRRDGWLHLRERATDRVALPAAPAPLSWDAAGERLLLAAPWMGGHVTVAAVTAGGALQLAATLRTGAPDLGVQHGFVAPVEGALTLGGIGGRALLRAAAPTPLLLLRGDVAERAVVE